MKVQISFEATEEELADLRRKTRTNFLLHDLPDRDCKVGGLHT